MVGVKPRNDEEAIRALSSLTNYERTRADGPRDFDLSRPRALLEGLGSPDRRLGSRVIQVAGTKGKGSTARFLDSILRAAGLRTGCYTSPHLEHVRERITIDGVPIAEAEFAARVGEVLDSVRARGAETTFFESMLAIACLQFARAETEAVIFEVGLGGRLDATTAVPCTANVITEISLEHTEILGDTVELVAAEKAGTIRPGVPLWSGVDPDSPAGRVIGGIAEERGAPWTYVPPPRDVTATPTGLRWDGYDLRVLGRHQAHNAALAIAAVSDLSDEVIRRGLAEARQPGCCEPRGSNPTVVLDGAHTAESIEATLRAVEEHFPGIRPTLVFALAEDKNLDRIAAAMEPRVADVFCTRVDDKRGRTAEELAAHPAWIARARAVPDAVAALDAARAAAGPDGLVLATGSLYLAGALRAHAT
jgi:dihydrofolate synthase/folylpolyglutamate synthase